VAAQKEEGHPLNQRMHTVEHTTRRAATSSLVIWLARLGYATKGFVYFLIGALAVQLALGSGGGTTDQRGALQTLAALPLGQVLLYIIAVGLCGFALWSLVQAIFDTEARGHDAKGIVARVGYAVTGISYALLCVGAFHLATSTGSAGKNTTASTRDWTALLLKQPFGVVLVILAGLLICGVGAFLWVKAYKAKFRQQLDLASSSQRVRQGIIFVGRVGYAALGTVFGLIGIFLVVAALHQNPGEAKGLDTVLQELIHQPFGPLWLGIVASGLVAYGVYSFMEARYRRVAGN
jgi:hypothetical protein